MPVVGDTPPPPPPPPPPPTLLGDASSVRRRKARFLRDYGGKYGFGEKGRPSSPGKPRISGDAILQFTLALEGVPGKDEEIIEQNGLID